jgi:hypothetical protein
MLKGLNPMVGRLRFYSDLASGPKVVARLNIVFMQAGIQGARSFDRNA